jgi:hypothetical protein
MSIRSGEHSCGPKNLVVCSWRAQSEPPRQRQAHGAGQSFLRLEPQLHIYGARTFTYASTHIGVSIRAGRHHATVRSIQLTHHSCDVEAERCVLFRSGQRTKPRGMYQMHCPAVHVAPKQRSTILRGNGAVPCARRCRSVHTGMEIGGGMETASPPLC